MQYELCATYDMNQVDNDTVYAGAASKWPRTGGFMSRADQCLDWITEKLDRKFVERCVNDDPVRKKELSTLKRTVLVLVCLGLGITAISIKFAIEAQLLTIALG